MGKLYGFIMDGPGVLSYASHYLFQYIKKKFISYHVDVSLKFQLPISTTFQLNPFFSNRAALISLFNVKKMRFEFECTRFSSN